MILPELESYQMRLEERARAWDESTETDLERDAAQCAQQVALLEKGIGEFTATIGRIPQEFAEEISRLRHRIDVLTQTRDLTGAYLHVLRNHLQRRQRA